MTGPAADDSELYDELPYESYAFAHTHPWRLGIIGRAFGVRTAPAAGCRVLELGCGTGWNAASMAWSMPGATVVAIDKSARQVAMGQEYARVLGVSDRCRVEVADLATVEAAALGTFDYVVAHGVYGWMPRAIEDRMVALGRACLAPGGIFYISTNVYPGSHVRDAARGMMHWWIDGNDPTLDGVPATTLLRATAGRAYMMRLGQAAQEVDGWWSSALWHEADVLGANSPTYAAHDHLSEFYRPSWFHELAAHARGHGLRYVADARMSTSLGTTLPEACRRHIGALSRVRPDEDERTEAERFQQILDHVTGRFFRRALFVRDDEPEVRVAPDAQALRAAWLVTVFDRDEDGVRRIEGREYRASPLADRALSALRAQAPLTMAFDALVATLEADGDAVARALMEAWGVGVLEVLTAPPRIARLSARPRMSWAARAEIAGGRGEATNLFHVTLKLSESARAIVPFLDGTRDRAALEAAVPEPEKLQTFLEWFANVAFLEAD